jgi:hypothetical protein
MVRASGPDSVIGGIPRKLGRLISCKDASRAISQMQDGSISLPLRLRIRLHLLWCEACKRFEQQMHFLRQAMQRYRQ